MEQLSFLEKACAFCCGIMAEMGNLLGMSYQRANVILFCWLEPGIFIGLFLTLLWGWMHLPLRRRLAWASLVVYTVAILATAVLLFVSTIMLLKQFHIGLEDPMSILNMNETNPMYLNWYNNTVQTLFHVGAKLGFSYAVVNLLLYVLLLPASIILCYTGTIKNLIRHT